tara:strand:- start:26 stop:1378 length:1353 start_codon:yes stop_codon:yes gene_type:complete
MGKKNNKKNKNGKKNNKKKELPFVSICTPTFNRRPFIPYMFKCFEHQTYPKDKMEWIIVDDGSDCIEDLINESSLKQYIKYVKLDKRVTLGKKRNIMHEHTKGDILVYMDDDDYYPPDRVKHAVDQLTKSKKALCAGSSEIYIYFKHIDQMVQFGPYRDNHATAGTFALKREMLKITKYNETASLAEEKEFLKNYTIPMVQLEPKKTILVFSHNHNTFDKKKLLTKNNKFMKYSDKTIDEFVKESDLKEFYLNQIDNLLKDYAPGDPINKPDVIAQMKEIEEKRNNYAKQVQQRESDKASKIMINNPDGTSRVAEYYEVVHILRMHKKEINDLKLENAELKGLLNQSFGEPADQNVEEAVPEADDLQSFEDAVKETLDDAETEAAPEADDLQSFEDAVKETEAVEEAVKEAVEEAVKEVVEDATKAAVEEATNDGPSITINEIPEEKLET